MSEAEGQRTRQMLCHEFMLWHEGKQFVAGIDEAGRGPLAGPVVAAAAILPTALGVEGINDSKSLSAKARQHIYQQLVDARDVHLGIGIVGERVIDTINILQATFLAMKKAIAGLSLQPHHILVDGSLIPDLHIPQTGIVKGDCKSLSIAAASIVAKVVRDEIMLEYDRKYPPYGFAEHKGYGTKKHRAMLELYGPCEIHRTTFAPVKEVTGRQGVRAL